MSTLPPEATEVFARLNEIVRASAEPTEVYDAIVRAAVELVDGCDRAAILLKERGRFVTAAASDEVSRSIDQKEIELDDGPCIDAIHADALQHDPDLTAGTPWPELASWVVDETPVRGMLGCRMLIDGEQAGALDLFSDTPMALTRESVEQAAIMTSVASVAIMGVRARKEAAHLERALDNSRAIGKAIGLIMASHRVDDDQAFGILRKTSQDLNMKLSTVAQEIVRGQSEQAARP